MSGEIDGNALGMEIHLFFNKHQVNLAQPQICLNLNNRPYCYKTIDLLFFSQHPSLNMLMAFMLIKKRRCMLLNVRPPAMLTVERSNRLLMGVSILGSSDATTSGKTARISARMMSTMLEGLGFADGTQGPIDVPAIVHNG